MKKRIYIIVTLQITIGERTIYPTMLRTFEVDSKLNKSEIETEIHKQSLEVAKGYTDNLDNEDEDSETFFFNGGELSVEVFTSKRVTKTELNVLKKYL